MIRRPILTLLLAGVFAAASLAVVLRLRIDTSLTSLFAKDDPAAAALVRVMDNFRSVEELLILVETDAAKSPQPDKLISFAHRLDTAINADPVASPLSGDVIYRSDEQSRRFFEQVLVPNGLFYLDDASFEAALQRLTRAEMAKQVRRNEQMIATPGPAADALAKVILKDPLHLHEFLIDRVGSSRPFKTSPNSDAFLSPDGRALLIRVRGLRPVSDMEFAKAFTASVRTVADRVNTDHLRLDYAGAYAIAAQSERAIRSDMISNVIWSVVMLQALFLLAYRRPLVSFQLAFMPVALGTLYGFGAYALLEKSLSPMTAVIGGILAGMSIDYSIEFLSYYHAARAAGATAADAARTTRRKIGLAVFAAWITSVIGFVAIGWSQVKLLRDFAILGSLGLAGAYVCAMLV
ncbi:MAG: MMPL family transporter, partial [Tepidisphaeraceae bacterium]